MDALVVGQAGARAGARRAPVAMASRQRGPEARRPYSANARRSRAVRAAAAKGGGDDDASKGAWPSNEGFEELADDPECLVLDDDKCGSYEIVQVPTSTGGQSPGTSGAVTAGQTQTAPGPPDVNEAEGEDGRAEVCVIRTDGFVGNERVCGNSIEFSSPTTQQNLFYWKTKPCSVLILKKLGPQLLPELYEMALWLHSEHGMRVIVEWADFKALHNSLPFLETFAPQVEAASLHRRVDFVLCLGGDGVILHASGLFTGAAPPIVSFNLGSLGFLANHSFADHTWHLTRLISAAQHNEPVYITLRMRLHCEILRKGKRLPGKTYSVLNVRARIVRTLCRACCRCRSFARSPRALGARPLPSHAPAHACARQHAWPRASRRSLWTEAPTLTCPRLSAMSAAGSSPRCRRTASLCRRRRAARRTA